MNSDKSEAMSDPVIPDAAPRFPDPRQEAAARGREFQSLSPQERWRAILELHELGMNLVRSSPRRAEIEKRWDEQEEEWRRIQRELFAKYGK